MERSAVHPTLFKPELELEGLFVEDHRPKCGVNPKFHCVPWTPGEPKEEPTLCAVKRTFIDP